MANYQRPQSSTLVEAMDIDPVDGGPRPSPRQPAPPPPPLLSNRSSPVSPTHLVASTSVSVITVVSKEEEARQAVEMLRSEDVASRVAAAHRLDTIATVLGPTRTREELVPFVTDGMDDEDEVLLAMAQSLGRMVTAVGGAEYGHVLLLPLELLLTVEETTVREAAAASTIQIAEQLPDRSMLEAYADLLARLSIKEWFTARMSAAGLIAHIYPRLRKLQISSPHSQGASKGQIMEEEEDDDVNNDQLLLCFAQLCRDDTPMVRRIAAQHVGTMVRQAVQVYGRSALQLPDGAVAQVLLPLFGEIASHDQPDAVRLQTTECCVAVGEVITALVTTPQDVEAGRLPTLQESEETLLQQILPLIVATVDDRSWRVRWTAAAKFANVVAAYEALPHAMDTLVPAYEKLLQDPEAEVRTAATMNFAHVARCRPKVLRPPLSPSRSPHDPDPSILAKGGAQQARVSVAERLVQRITTLTEDDSEHVRAALAMVATELAPVLGKDATITYLVPPVLLLLRDAAAEVRLNLISSLGALNEVIGVDLLSQSLLPAILDLAQDGKWRIRWAMIHHIPLLAEQLGKEFFTEKLVSLCVGWLGDDIATIRLAAAVNLKDLTALFGAEWAAEFLIPSIADIRRHESYLRRLTALQALSLMAQVMDSNNARIVVLPLLLDMATDVVPNIRFNLAKELQTMAPVCGVSSYESQVLPVLSMLMEDDDRDVRYYAEKTADALDETFASVTA